MANPFGEIVDDVKLDTMAEYVGKPKTQEDRAREAMLLINENGKQNNAAAYVSTLAPVPHVQGLLYNGTGETLTVVDRDDWQQSVAGRTPYPTFIGNGQWVAFCVVPGGNEAALVYRGKNGFANTRDFLIAWTTYGRRAVLVDVGSSNTFGNSVTWSSLRNRLRNASQKANIAKDGVIMEGTISSGNTARLIVRVYIPHRPRE